MLKKYTTKKILIPTLIAGFFAAFFLFLEFEPWPEKYLLLFEKNEKFFEMPEFKENCDISDFGAISDGKTKNTNSFKMAIEACAKKGGGNVVVPRGKWLTGAIQLQSNINLQLKSGSEVIFSDEPEDYRPVVQTRWEGIEVYNYSPFIYANGAENISITGTGKLIGQGAKWQSWNNKQEDAFARLYKLAQEKISPAERIFGTKKDSLRPSFVQFFNCKNIILKDFSIQDGPMWTIHMVFSENILAENLKISSFGYNSDGFVIDSSKNVVLNKLEISSGDDAISIKSGLEPDIWNRNIPTENVTIKNSFIDAGHAGVAIGSEMSGGIKNITIKQNYFCHLDWALRIKSIRGRGGYIENISLQDLKLLDIDQILAIDLQYSAPTLSPTTDELPRIENISMRNIRGERVAKIFYLRGLPKSPIKNVMINDTRLKASDISEMISSENISIENMRAENANTKELFIQDSRFVIFKNSELCKKNKPKCITIDGKDNDEIHFTGSNVTRKNIDLNNGAKKEVFTIFN